MKESAELAELEKPLTIEFPEWLQCPYCGDEGTKEGLSRFGHTCCRRYLKELENE
jgi:hypothetical protein